ncbi:cysteine proteinase, partial [Sporormia fimetaria CBS 119925]
PLAWLNDNIVNEYMNLLIDHEKRKAGYVHRKNGPAPPVHAFPSQWWVSASRDLKSVQRWATRKQFGGKNLLDVKLLFIPVCVKSHWRLIAIKPQERIIEYLDSLSSGQDAQILQKVFEWLQQELGADFIASEWNVIEKQRSMRQQNGSDCGVFTCLNALALLRGEDPDLVEVDNGMHNARRIIAASLISGKLQGELE